MRVSYLFLLFCLFIIACRQNSASKLPPQLIAVQGQTMGTTYQVKYLDSLNRNFKPEIDRYLEEINMDLSTYIEDAFISRFNRATSQITLQDPTAHTHFQIVFGRAQEIYKDTKGAFDPTIMPLVNYWGFGYKEKRPVLQADSLKVDSLLQLVGFDKASRTTGEPEIVFYKSIPGLELDFSAIAKGYAVDAIGYLLEEKGIQNYLVEIGRELRALGKNDRGQWWTIGINTPKEEAGLNDLEAILQLRNRSVASSGNYRNYYEVNGVKYGHEINPRTGYPEKNDLLSVSVFAEDCMTADALATAFMIMGLKESLALVETTEGVEAFFIYGAPDGEMKVKMTKGLEREVKKLGN